MWNKPWKYREGIAISVGLLITGALLQVSIGPVEWLVFIWPANIIALAILIVALGLFYALRSKVYLFKFMTQVEAAVPALAAASVLTIIMGLSRQVPEGRPAVDPIGLTRMLSFWPFVLIYLWNIVIVAEVGIQQLMHFQKRFIPSLISHLGLFVFVTCGTLGSADMQRLKMYCEEGKPEWRGIDDHQEVHELPLAIELQKFTIDEYPPKLAIFDSKTGKVLPKDKPQNIIIEQNFTSEELLGWNITVEKYIEDAMPASMLKMMKGMPAQMMQMMKMDDLGMRINAGGFVEYKGKGAATAILIKAQKGSAVKKGWVSSGSYMFPMSSLKLDDKTEIAMSAREPLRYASDVNVYTQDGNAIQAHIEVNKPFSIGSWKIYQLDFNKEQGKWSTLSVYELVSDPWLPATYVGIYLLLIGAVLMFITAGRNKYKKEEDKK
ncbi:MAG: cytochrome c biogenesis protein ResB [Prevotella intermedia]